MQRGLNPKTWFKSQIVLTVMQQLEEKTFTYQDKNCQLPAAGLASDIWIQTSNNKLI